MASNNAILYSLYHPPASGGAQLRVNPLELNVGGCTIRTKGSPWSMIHDSCGMPGLVTHVGNHSWGLPLEGLLRAVDGLTLTQQQRARQAHITKLG